MRALKNLTASPLVCRSNRAARPAGPGCCTRFVNVDAVVLRSKSRLKASVQLSVEEFEHSVALVSKPHETILREVMFSATPARRLGACCRWPYIVATG